MCEHPDEHLTAEEKNARRELEAQQARDMGLDSLADAILAEKD